MAYKRTMESIYTAIYYGHAYNRYDRYEYNDATHEIHLTKAFIKALEELEVSKLCTFNLKTGNFVCHEWEGHTRASKITVGEFLVECMAIFEVTSIQGPKGFHQRWDSRFEKIQLMKEVQRRLRE